jgi:hypothetical protein
MKRLLIFAASAIFFSGTAHAREVIASPTAAVHKPTVGAERRVAQLTSAAHKGAAPCTTMYIATMRGDGTSDIRKSVDCEE